MNTPKLRLRVRRTTTEKYLKIYGQKESDIFIATAVSKGADGSVDG